MPLSLFSRAAAADAGLIPGLPPRRPGAADWPGPGGIAGPPSLPPGSTAPAGQDRVTIRAATADTAPGTDALAAAAEGARACRAPGYAAGRVFA